MTTELVEVMTNSVSANTVRDGQSEVRIGEPSCDEGMDHDHAGIGQSKRLQIEINYGAPNSVRVHRKPNDRSRGSGHYRP